MCPKLDRDVNTCSQTEKRPMDAYDRMTEAEVWQAAGEALTKKEILECLGDAFMALPAGDYERVQGATAALLLSDPDLKPGEALRGVGGLATFLADKPLHKRGESG
jgi:hypothetical protein